MSKVKEFDPSLQDWRVRILVKILLTPRLRNIHIGVRRPVQSDLKRRNCAHGSHVVISRLRDGSLLSISHELKPNDNCSQSSWMINRVMVYYTSFIFWHFKSSTRDGIPLQTTSCSSELTG
ncbi:hypothetical protein LENED_003567 [Lentinula edodes]|uniref:Uncharacterized protein n=1 Tax=Lentinula edodes TaxID=5353 RepID=A0A1Q3E445_LENED|nr:hypothetical protein LENED_003567 [Lentinula edodes]